MSNLDQELIIVRLQLGELKRKRNEKSKEIISLRQELKKLMRREKMILVTLNEQESVNDDHSTKVLRGKLTVNHLNSSAILMDIIQSENERGQLQIEHTDKLFEMFKIEDELNKQRVR